MAAFPTVSSAHSPPRLPTPPAGVHPCPPRPPGGPDGVHQTPAPGSLRRAAHLAPRGPHVAALLLQGVHDAGLAAAPHHVGRPAAHGHDFPRPAAAPHATAHGVSIAEYRGLGRGRGALALTCDTPGTATPSLFFVIQGKAIRSVLRGKVQEGGKRDVYRSVGYFFYVI